ncbi:MAG TPA: hemerythrin domain-containing protein [Candidatus Saccharimonadales bacterium]|nr:hemerythrin domain-containing protein [Candidatus Saccharimonadales bacterium]
MTAGDSGEAPFGRLMHRQLRLIHQMLRNDLAVCRDLAGDVAAGATAADITEQIAALQTRSPVWTLQVNCLYHCRVVHAHHGHEDADMFPALRRSNPELSAVVDKLESDHRAISDLLDDVETAAGELEDTPANPARTRLVTALGRLENDLLAHLAFEEESIASTMRGWQRWP